MEYTRPQLTKEEEREAMDGASKLVRKYGMRNFGTLLSSLCRENMLLVKEINEHRLARGIEPLKTYEV